MKIEESELTKLQNQSPQKVFEILYESLGGKLITYAKRAFRLSNSAAEDVVHDAFLPWVEHPEKCKVISLIFSFFYAGKHVNFFQAGPQPVKVNEAPQVPVSEKPPVIAAKPIFPETRLSIFSAALVRNEPDFSSQFYPENESPTREKFSKFEPEIIGG